MTADPLASWWTAAVTVERFTGTGGYGDTYASPATVTGFVDDGQKLVTGLDGEQIMSTARVFLPLTVEAIPLQSKVTLPAEFSSRETQVVAVARHATGGLPVPAHWEIALQ